jgi:hypothetical protein
MPLLSPGDQLPSLSLSLSPLGQAAVTGAFVNPGPVHLQSTGFVLAPDGKMVVSVYSSGTIGRLLPEDVLDLVHYLREHAEA